MHKSYLWAEQIGQMQAKYDAMNLIKIAFDAGCDVVTEPINYYVHDFGSQYTVFWECLERIFGEVAHTFEGMNQYGSSVNTYQIPMPELREFFRIVDHAEQGKYVSKFMTMMAHSDDYFCEFEMEGMVAGNCLHVTLTNEMGLYAPMLKQLVAIRTIVREEIRKRKRVIINGLRNLVLSKMVYDRLGIVVDISLDEHVNVVFSRILELLEFNLVLGPDDAFSYETMIEMLNTFLDQRVIQTNRGDVAA
ncbi:hypothetical protein L1N85_19735 [Paenibacillus alkaliterrae]|uniref:hypothetical protein n=1 Tax=Paenibacillus alkaliterrae TaxID=320909 RepID=UPI001F2689EB|nr:hypothetical protein [Paenibacillus alkaliterrae]MCF2940628.1 hypothetical protein [Paenibacillus alkaliterrae]